MFVIGLIREVKRVGTADQQGAILTVETEEPLQIHQIRMFNQSVSDGTVAQLESLVSQALPLPLQLGDYKGKAQLSWSAGSKLAVPTRKAS